MLDRVGDNNIQDHLTALADGELDAAQVLAVIDYLVAHPDALTAMRANQRVRLAARRAMRALTPPVPDALRRKIEAAASAAAPSRGPRKWPMPLFAVAAALLVGLLVGRWALQPPATRVVVSQPTPEAPTAVEPVPPTLIAYASRVHADCSRLEVGLHAAGYPQELSGLAGAVRADLSAPASHPDLSAIGYQFVGAGPCGEPLKGTVHLLYHSVDKGQGRTISVFVQANQGQFKIDRGKLYLLSGPRSPFPVYAWRTDAVVYFLVADNDATAKLARAQIAVASSS